MLKKFSAWSIRHIERALNEEAHEAAQSMIGKVFVMKADLPLYCGKESLAVAKEEFLLTGLVPRLLIGQRSMGLDKELINTSSLVTHCT